MQPMHNKANEITISSKADYIHAAMGDEQHGVKPIDTVAAQRTWSKRKKRKRKERQIRVSLVDLLPRMPWAHPTAGLTAPLLTETQLARQGLTSHCRLRKFVIVQLHLWQRSTASQRQAACLRCGNHSCCGKPSSKECCLCWCGYERYMSGTSCTFEYSSCVMPCLSHLFVCRYCAR